MYQFGNEEKRYTVLTIDGWVIRESHRSGVHIFHVSNRSANCLEHLDPVHRERRVHNPRREEVHAEATLRKDGANAAEQATHGVLGGRVAAHDGDVKVRSHRSDEDQGLGIGTQSRSRRRRKSKVPLCQLGSVVCTDGVDLQGYHVRCWRVALQRHGGLVGLQEWDAKHPGGCDDDVDGRVRREKAMAALNAATCEVQDVTSVAMN